MALTLDDLTFLQSDVGSALITELAQQDLSQSKLLPLITKLRQNYTQAQVHAVITIAQLRQKASSKFGDDASQLLLTDDALQQASDPYIRSYRSQGFEGLRILDVCCGIGTDSIAFAQSGASVHGVDLDEVRIAMARHNAEALGLDVQFTVADVTQNLVAQDYDLIFFDPARRTTNGKRIYDVEQYMPPLSLIKQWDAPQKMVKISPGVDLDQLSDYDASVEFISVDGDLKEAVLHQPYTVPYRATMIQKGVVHQWQKTAFDDLSVVIDAPHGWLCEPDPSILRSNLVQDITHALNGTMLDNMIAYFCTPTMPNSPWVRAWKIREWLPFNLKKLKRRLKAMDVGTLTVKKRGSPIAPEELIRKLKLKGTQSATVVLTRYHDDPIAIICDDILPV